MGTDGDPSGELLQRMTSRERQPVSTDAGPELAYRPQYEAPACPLMCCFQSISRTHADSAKSTRLNRTGLGMRRTT
jgi:hypothetical protein